MSTSISVWHATEPAPLNRPVQADPCHAHVNPITMYAPIALCEIKSRAAGTLLRSNAPAAQLSPAQQSRPQKLTAGHKD